MAKNRIVIFVESGFIQRIDSDQTVEVVIFDYDTEGGDGEGLHPVRDVDGTVEDVYVSRWYIEPDPETVECFFGQVGEEVQNEMDN